MRLLAGLIIVAALGFGITSLTNASPDTPATSQSAETVTAESCGKSCDKAKKCEKCADCDTVKDCKTCSKCK